MEIIVNQYPELSITSISHNTLIGYSIMVYF